MAQVVLLVHGMGNDAGGPAGKVDRKAWAKDVEAVLRAASNTYGIKDEQLIFESILYDDVFQRYALTWQKLAKALEATPLERLTRFMNNAADGGFLWGSLGDVVQYRGLELVRQNVHTAVAKQIADVVSRRGPTHNYSVLGHSLGTAVAHDAIRALATRAVLGNVVMHPPNFKFSNFFALANVSKLVWATTDDFYRDTPVRPYESGLPYERCAVNHYLNFRHVADPVASLIRFQPKGWAPTRFQNVPLRHLRDVNVHGFMHYLSSPQVTGRILARLFPLKATLAQRTLQENGFADYVDPHADAKKIAVESVAALLDRLSGQARGKLELDIDALAKATWESRALLAKALQGLVT